MSEWKDFNIDEISLADALKFVVDNRGKTVPTANEGIALIATNCISNDYLYPQKLNLRYVSQDIFDNWFRSHPQTGDIILTNKGSNNGEVCLVPETIDFCIAQDMVAMRANENKIYPLYLFAALRSKLVQKRIKYLNVDAVIPHFKKTDFNKLLIPLPERKLQEFIGKIYFDFSYKIENLRRQNETLENIAQTLFKHWFIDFEFPNTEGKPYKSSGGVMVSSELGDIPEGWRVGTVGEEFEIIMGQSPAGSSFNENKQGIIFFQGRTDFGFRFPTIRLYTTEPSRIAEKFDVLVSVRAPVGDVNLASEKCCIGRGLAAVKSQYKSYCLHKIKSFKKLFNVFESEGTVFGSINKQSFNSLESIIPINKVIKDFEAIITTIDQKFYVNDLQIQTLTKIRDSLLPKLMSGQIRVKE